MDEYFQNEDKIRSILTTFKQKVQSHKENISSICSKEHREVEDSYCEYVMATINEIESELKMIIEMFHSQRMMISDSLEYIRSLEERLVLLDNKG
jgi:hypothetical protein